MNSDSTRPASRALRRTAAVSALVNRAMIRTERGFFRRGRPVRRRSAAMSAGVLFCLLMSSPYHFPSDSQEENSGFFTGCCAKAKARLLAACAARSARALNHSRTAPACHMALPPKDTAGGSS